MVWCAGTVCNHNRAVSSSVPLSSWWNTEFSTSELTELVLCFKLPQAGSQTALSAYQCDITLVLFLFSFCNFVNWMCSECTARTDTPLSLLVLRLINLILHIFTLGWFQQSDLSMVQQSFCFPCVAKSFALLFYICFLLLIMERDSQCKHTQLLCTCDVKISPKERVL